MPQKEHLPRVSDKEQKMYEHIKKSELEQGRSKDKAKEIAAATVTEQPTLSRVVDQLESEGLVERRTSKEDSRFVYVDLTGKGEAAFAAIAPLAQRHQSASSSAMIIAAIAPTSTGPSVSTSTNRPTPSGATGRPHSSDSVR